MSFRARLMEFMRGRNGADELGRFESLVTIILIVISWFCPYVYYVALILLIHMMFRTLSRNIAKRQMENRKYCQLRYQFFVWKDKVMNRIKQRKNYRFYKCPMCKQQVRVPKGHGRISITCPKCREEFIRRS